MFRVITKQYISVVIDDFAMIKINEKLSTFYFFFTEPDYHVYNNVYYARVKYKKNCAKYKWKARQYLWPSKCRIYLKTCRLLEYIIDNR